jgi:hypothetical protein
MLKAKTQEIEKLAAARERAELYFAAHPRSPSAVRRPKLSKRSNVWVALLGKNLEHGVVGFGPTVETALRAFDARDLSALRSPLESSSRHRVAA